MFWLLYWLGLCGYPPFGGPNGLLFNNDPEHPNPAVYVVGAVTLVAVMFLGGLFATEHAPFLVRWIRYG